MQIFADVLNVDVEVPCATELGAMGAAMSAGIAARVFSSMKDAVQKWSKAKCVYHPCKEAAAYYQKKYNVYRSLIDAMNPIWSQIDMLGDTIP